MSVTQRLYLDDGTGTFPTNISSRFRQVDGASVNGYGRTDEFSQPGAASLTVVLDNADGHVTDGTVAIEPGTLIRYTETIGATTRNHFTGRVESLDLGWPGGGEEYAVVTVTAYDALADLGRRTMRSMLEEEVLALAPLFYFPLGEQEGAASAGDISANVDTLTPAGTGGAPAFGADIGLLDGSTAVSFSGGQYLATDDNPDVTSFVCVVSTTATTQRTILGGGSMSLVVEADGTLAVFMVGALSFSSVPIDGSVVIDDGLPHVVAVVIDGSTGRLYVDGDQDATASIPIGGVVPFTVAGVGGGSGLGGSPLVGSVSHVAGFSTALTPTQVSDISDAALTGFAGESTSSRLARIAGYAAVTTSTTSGMSGQTMAAQQTAGSSMFDALQTVATAEGGVLYANGSGTVVLQGRHYRSTKTTADLTLGQTEPGSDTTVTWDTEQLINQVTVTRSGGATQVYPPLASDDLVYPQSLDLAVDADDDALNAAQWVSSKHSTTAPRLASVTFDLLTSGSAASILDLEIGDRLAFSAMPSQLWSGSTDFTVEGWSATTGLETATVTVNLLPWDLFEAFILDDATYGVLDSSTPIGY